MNASPGSAPPAAASRRNFLALAGAGAAAAAAVAVVPAVHASGASNGGSAAIPELPAGAQAMLAHITDIRTGEIAVMVAGRQVVVTDHALVAKLAQAVAGATK